MCSTPDCAMTSEDVVRHAEENLATDVPPGVVLQQSDLLSRGQSPGPAHMKAKEGGRCPKRTVRLREPPTQ